jgi:hypothetical protein
MRESGQCQTALVDVTSTFATLGAEIEAICAATTLRLRGLGQVEALGIACSQES